MYKSVYYLLMRLREFRQTMKMPIFYTYQVERLFGNESKNLINTQLSRMVKRGDLVRLKRGVYRLAEAEVDELVLAGWLYKPSYVSLESVLQMSGVIPEVVGKVTSVTTVTSKEVKTGEGVFLYSKIAKELFFGYEKVKDEKSGLYYNLAEPEKALLDWIYVRRVKSLEGERVDMSELNKKKLRSYVKIYPKWVRKVIDE